jgi:hypothetical protein
VNATPAPTAPTVDSFAEIVHDILAERWPEQDETAVNEVAARITDAYVPRVGAERMRAVRTQREMRALVDRDAALHNLLAQAKRSAQLFLDGQDGALAQLEGHRAVLRRVAVLAETAEDGMVSVAELRPLLQPPAATAGPRLPFMIGIHPATVFAMGTFTRGTMPNPDDLRAHYPFAGWAIVLHGGPTAVTTVVEPAFLVDGLPVAQSILAIRGYHMEDMT